MARALLAALALVVTAGATGCATTRIVHQWSNPDYPAARFKKILVLGITDQPSIRRAFEDEFVARLKAAGVDAVPGYRVIPEDGPVPEARLQEAARQAGADATLVTRLVRVEQQTRVSSGPYYPGSMFGAGFYPWYSAGWLGYYDARAYPYDVYISETSLHDATRNQMVWTGTVRTTAPSDITREIRRYVDAVTEVLQSRGLLGTT